MAAVTGAVSLTEEEEGERTRMRRHQVIVLAGPTAVGKSDVAAALSNHNNNGVVVSADSVQAYAGVEIGANKPSADERRATPHLLVDLVADPATKYNAAEWQRDALYAIEQLLGLNQDNTTEEGQTQQAQRRRLQIDEEIARARQLKGVPPEAPVTPIVVGGTMMYLQWLVHGRPDAMRPSPGAVEKALQLVQHYQQQQPPDDNDDDPAPEDKEETNNTSRNWEQAVERVNAMGEKFQQQASKLAPNDWYRLRRIMEVAFTVQEALEQGKSSTQAADESSSKMLLDTIYNGQRQGGLLSPSSPSWGHLVDVRCYFLCPHDRMTHAKIVDERCEQMIVRGLMQETTRLAVARALPDMAARAIGYRQTLDYLQQQSQSPAAATDDDNDDDDGTKKEKDDDEAAAFLQYLEKFTAATRQYSKRQMQWFRKDDEFVFVSVDMSLPKADRVTQAAETVQAWQRLDRDAYDAQRRDPDSTSAHARAKNQAQGKGMKVYQWQRQVLKDDGALWQQALREAQACIRQFAGSGVASTTAMEAKDDDHDGDNDHQKRAKNHHP